MAIADTYPLYEVLNHVHGASLLGARRALINAHRSFLEISRAWESGVPTSIAQVFGVANQYLVDYGLTGVEPFDVLMVHITTKPPMEMLSRSDTQQRANIRGSFPEAFRLVSVAAGVATIELQGDDGANHAANLHVTCALRPTFNAGGVSTPWTLDPQFDSYREEIVLGAAGRLLIQPGRPWPDQALGSAYIKLLKQRAETGDVIRPDSGARHTSKRPTPYGGYGRGSQ